MRCHNRGDPAGQRIGIAAKSEDEKEQSGLRVARHVGVL